ncbi:hypothetical protein [Lentzea sp. NPDC051838]|uniref:hypothetical protein n=1 Tax=Lentzea sp. NPDC051838 TaxID=3154849 RepID=UPI0034197A02
MADTPRSFVRAMSSLWGRGYWVTWHPSTRLRLGEVGTAGEGEFVGISSLQELEITAPSTLAETRDDLTWRSEGGVNVTTKASGQTSPLFQGLADAQAGMLVEFTQGNAILVAYKGLSETRLASQPALAVEMLRRYWLGTWSLDWYVVSHVVTAESGTVLMSRDGRTAVELAASASVLGGAIGLADLAAGVQVARSSGLALELIGTEMTPFFRVVRLRKRFLRGVEATYGEPGRLRSAAGRPAELPAELVEEAREDTDSVLELPDQAADD